MVQEYTVLRDEVENKRWALRELRHSAEVPGRGYRQEGEGGSFEDNKMIKLLWEMWKDGEDGEAGERPALTYAPFDVF